MNFNIHIKRLLFYWVSSFVLATVVYYFLWIITPGHYVFGMLYRMVLYHCEYPLQFILIPCFFYGIIATCLASFFSKQKIIGRILLTILIILLTVLLSSPLGGMLWYYYDFKAGYFPVDWLSRMIIDGSGRGFLLGWLIVGLSIPYNMIGSVICFFLTRKGARMYRQTEENQQSID